MSLHTVSAELLYSRRHPISVSLRVLDPYRYLTVRDPVCKIFLHQMQIINCVVNVGSP